jgi:hypothetical protein
LALSTAIVIGQGERLLHAQNANDPNGADSQSEDKTNPGFSQGIRIGSVKDGKVAAFIPLIDPAIGSAEELAVDDQGNVFAGFTAQGKMAVRKFVKN